MISNKKIKGIYILLFSSIFSFHFYQLFTQHWSGVLDHDLVIIYNSLLLNSGIEQEFRDHPAFTTFLVNSVIYKLISFFSNVPVDIENVLNSNNINEVLQFYFNISRSVNFFFNLLIIFIFNKILKKLEIKNIIRFIASLIFIISIGYISSLFVIRSENLSLLFLLFSINSILCKKRELKLNFFIAGIFFAFAMLAKIQIIFLFIYLIYLITFVNQNKSYKFNDNNLLKKYYFLSLFFGIIVFFIFQIYIQEFPRFINNKYIDLLFFTVSFLIVFIYFYLSNNFKKNLILFSSLLNGFIFLIIFIFILDRINLIPVNDYIFLRITNPIHYMTEFTGEMANGLINMDYITKNIFHIFSYYRFNFFELLLLIILIFLNFKKKNYLFVIFFIFAFNTLVMNFRYSEIYHLFYVFIYLMFFIEAVKKLNNNLSVKFIFLALIIFFTNSLNFFFIKKDGYIAKILSRENAMIKVCNEFNYKIPTGNYLNVAFIKYYHHKIDDIKIKKICDELI